LRYRKNNAVKANKNARSIIFTYFVCFEISIKKTKNVHKLLPKRTQEVYARFPIPILAKKTAFSFVMFLLAVRRMTN